MHAAGLSNLNATFVFQNNFQIPADHVPGILIINFDLGDCRWYHGGALYSMKKAQIDIENKRNLFLILAE